MLVRRLLLGLVASLMALAGCGSDGGDEASGAGSSTSKVEETVPEVEPVDDEADSSDEADEAEALDVTDPDVIKNASLDGVFDVTRTVETNLRPDSPNHRDSDPRVFLFAERCSEEVCGMYAIDGMDLAEAEANLADESFPVKKENIMALSGTSYTWGTSVTTDCLWTDDGSVHTEDQLRIDYTGELRPTEVEVIDGRVQVTKFEGYFSWIDTVLVEVADGECEIDYTVDGAPSRQIITFEGIRRSGAS